MNWHLRRAAVPAYCTVGESLVHGSCEVTAAEIMEFARRYDPQRSISTSKQQRQGCSAV